MSGDVRGLTRAQVRWIEDRACSLYDIQTWGSALEQAINDLAAKPGESGWCEEKDCEWWEAKLVRDYRGGTFRHGLSYCQHKDAKKGFCPMEGSDE